MSELVFTGFANWHPEHVNCPQCGQQITYYDAKGSSHYGCPNCHTFFEYDNNHAPRIIKRFELTDLAVPALPIGTVGTIHEREYMVIGFMKKREVDEDEQWTEYVLFNKDYGYAMLVEFHGHWMFVQKADRSYNALNLGSGKYVIHDEGKRYELYHSYKFTIVYALGEFDWNIFEDEELIAYEYIDPPFMLIHENHPQRSDWYKGEYFEPGQIADAFKVKKGSLPGRRGVGVIQPQSFNDLWEPLIKVTVISVSLTVLLYFLFSFFHPEKEVLNENYYSAADTALWNGGAGKPIMTGSIPITQSGAVEIELHADIYNDWVELPVTLYNEQTGASYEFTKALEYYAGTEDGESWSEGDKEGTIIINHLPAGNYRMNIYPYREGKKDTNVHVTVTQNTPLYSNLFTMLFLLLVFPAIQGIRRNAFENSRWGND